MNEQNEKDEIRKEGDTTIYRENDDRMRGKDIQSHARGEAGDEDISGSSATSGGSAGKTEEIDRGK